MKRSLFLLLAVLTALFAILVATDVISFETDRVDRWAMIVGFGSMAFFLAMASADSSSPTSGQAVDAPGPRGASQPPQTAASPMAPLPPRPSGPARRSPIDVEIDNASPLPPRVGSLFAEPDRSAPAEAPRPTPDSADLVALETEPVPDSGAGLEIPEVSDDEQIDEITSLVEQADEDGQGPVDAGPAPSTDAGAPASPGTDVDLGTAEQTLEPADVEAQPLARLDLRLADYDDEALRRVVKESEALVIAEMVRTGQLTSAGELTERDIASMVFLSYTSEEMLDELRLRKALDDTEGHEPGDVALTDRALAPLKNME